ALMKNFGFSQRARKRQLRKTLLMYGLPAIVLAAGIAMAGNYWLGHKAKGSMTVSRSVEPVETPAPAPPENPPPAPAPEPSRPTQPVTPVVAATVPSSSPSRLPSPAPSSPA